MPGRENSERLLGILGELGIRYTQRSSPLNHPRLSLSIYFNRKRDDSVYFAAYKKDEHLFRDEFWDFISAQQKKDRDNPAIITVVPKAGLEKQAFDSLLG